MEASPNRRTNLWLPGVSDVVVQNLLVAEKKFEKARDHNTRSQTKNPALTFETFTVKAPCSCV